jgi:hypothetical protein
MLAVKEVMAGISCEVAEEVAIREGFLRLFISFWLYGVVRINLAIS